MSEERKNEMVPISPEVEVIEQTDDRMIFEKMTGQTIQDPGLRLFFQTEWMDCGRSHTGRYQ